MCLLETATTQNIIIATIRVSVLEGFFVMRSRGVGCVPES